jgi:hypothetical protein
MCEWNIRGKSRGSSAIAEPEIGWNVNQDVDEGMAQIVTKGKLKANKNSK